MSRIERRSDRRRTARTNDSGADRFGRRRLTGVLAVLAGVASLASVSAVSVSDAVCLFAVVGAPVPGGDGVGRAARPRPRTERRRRAVDATRPPREADPGALSLLAEPYETVEDARIRLRGLERYFRDRGDGRAVFLTVYARVTEEVAAAVGRGAFENPEWVADYLVEFANHYRRAALAFETGREAALPTAWRVAFRAAERDGTLVLQHAALGVNAHVAFDLAFALCELGVGDDRRAKYADHRRINRVLKSLVDETLDRLADRYAPGIATLTAAVGPLVELCWFGALVLGRECAWWIAVLLTEAPGGTVARASRWFVAAASAAVAGAVLAPTASPASARAVRAVLRRLGVRRL